MYDEAEYIYQQFQANFAERKKNPIILYGIGNNTGKLLSKITDYNIAGLMDGTRKNGCIWRLLPLYQQAAEEFYI